MRGNTYSKKQSSEQISRKLSEFIKEIQYKNRNPVDNNVLKMLHEMETNPDLLFDSQQYLYRSKMGGLLHRQIARRICGLIIVIFHISTVQQGHTYLLLRCVLD